MKKSSLGRKSSIAAGRKTSDFIERKSSIPVLSRSTSALTLTGHSVSRKRDLSADRVSICRKRDASLDRMSELSTPVTHRTPRLLTMSSGRPSSISTKKGDTRTLTDKAWQALAVDIIYKALNSDMEGTNLLKIYKALKPVSLALFVDACNHLLGKLDPNIELTRVNYCTELPFILKKLQYKGKVDKMMLQTVNTPHNWPYVLGILHFLAELVIAAEAFKSNGLDSIYPEPMEGDSSDGEELIFKHVVPLLLHLWSSVEKQEDIDIHELLQNNKDLVNQVIQLSGFTDEVFRVETGKRKQYEEAKMRNDELSETLYKIESQNKLLNDKLTKNIAKNNDYKKEVDALQAKYQEKLDSIAEIETELRHIEEESSLVQGMLNEFGHSDQDSMSADDYNSYKTKKQSLKEEIKFEEISIFELEELLLEETFNVSKLKKECEKLFREYNSKIYELMKDDVSLRNALCLTRPQLGVTPCNEATAKFLEKTLQSYEERIASLEKDLKQNSEDSNQFKLSEEVKDKMAFLAKLKMIHQETSSDHEKVKLELEKKLMEITKENDKTNDEILKAQEFLEKNHNEYSEKEIEFQKKEIRLRKFFDICQKKLDNRYRSIIELDQKLQAVVDQIKSEFNAFADRLEILKNGSV